MSDSTPNPLRSEPQSGVSRGRVVLVFALVITLLISAGAAFVALKPSSVPVSTAGSSLAKCPANDNGVCVASAAIEIAQEKGPVEGLNAVRIILETRQDLLQGCHIIAHEVGKRFLATFGDEAIVPGNEWCSFGYYHGLLTSFGQGNLEGLVGYANKVCSSIEPTPSEDCMHGLGHASYVATDSLRDAMVFCEDLEAKFATTCADAVIMEDIFASNNGRMMTSFSPEDCMSLANTSVQAGCARGLTAELSKQGLDLPRSCGVYTNESIYSYCADGFGGSLAGNYLSGSGSATPAQLSSCAEDSTCSTGFGWIAYMYQLDLNAIESVCREVMAGSNVEECVNSARSAAKHEQIKR
jgi:hypothetical protein